MACHLSHKLPWDTIHELFKCKPIPDAQSQPQRFVMKDGQRKKLQHFARCLSQAIGDFAETDRSSEDERIDWDPHEWPGDHRASGAGAWMGFYDTLACGYVLLNVLIMDGNAFQRRCEYRRTQEQRIIQLLLGDHDGGHPPELADLLRPAFDDSEHVVKLQPRTGETMQILRDHAARLFRSMYSISRENRLLDSEYLARVIEWLL